MIWYGIERSVEPKITGVNDGSAQLETFYTKERQSLSIDARERLETTCRRFFQQKQGIYIEDFETLGIQGMVLYRSKKRVTEIDVLEALIQNSFGVLKYVFSEKAVAILEAHQLPPYEKIAVTIPEFTDQYYLVRLAELPMTAIDYPASLFWKDGIGEVCVETYDAYRQTDFRLYQTHLNSSYRHDVIVLGKNLFFSANLIAAFEEANIIGYERTAGTVSVLEKDDR